MGTIWDSLLDDKEKEKKIRRERPEEEEKQQPSILEMIAKWLSDKNKRKKQILGEEIGTEEIGDG